MLRRFVMKRLKLRSVIRGGHMNFFKGLFSVFYVLAVFFLAYKIGYVSGLDSMKEDMVVANYKLQNCHDVITRNK